MTAKIEAPEVFWGKGVSYQRREDGDYNVVCGRCGGTGYLSGYEYVEGGVCFACNGHQGAQGSISKADADKRYAGQVRYRERKEAKRLAICAERDARVARLVESAPRVAEVLQEVYDSNGYFNGRRNSFLSSLADQVFPAEGRDLSEKQVAAVEKMLAKVEADRADAAPVVEGRGVVDGEVLAISRVYTDFGEAVKVTVKDERGFRVYGTLAKDLVKSFYDAWYAKTVEATKEGYGSLVSDYGADNWFEEVKGARVSFTATVVKSRDDESFGFFSRPTKGSVVKAA